MKVSHLPLRVSTGAFILNSGLGKRSLEGEAAQGMHGMAVGAIPQLGQLDPNRRIVAEKLVDPSALVMGATAENLHDRVPHV
ncbi:hypothetical protein ABT351_35240, partial [Micromonospora sp. NPDC000018]